MVSLFQRAVPLWRELVMQSAVSTVTGARKQRDHLAGGASKEQPGTCLCTECVYQCLCVSECVCNTLFLEFTLERVHRTQEDAPNCRLSNVIPLISDNKWKVRDGTMVV